MNIKKTFIYQTAKKAYLSVNHTICDARRTPLISPLKDCLFRLKTRGGESQNADALSIISSNCFAGRIMQDLNMEYNSPTLGLYFMYPDYIEFLNNLRYYLSDAKIEFVKHSKYPIGDERRAAWSHWYPIGLLGGKVEIHFLHYHTEKEAAEKWYRRAKRVNFNNLLIIGMQQNLCKKKDIIYFDTLPYKNKIMFSTIPVPLVSNEYMPEFGNAESVGDPYKKAHLFYRHLISHFSI